MSNKQTIAHDAPIADRPVASAPFGGPSLDGGNKAMPESVGGHERWQRAFTTGKHE